ncbi:hypothetical protein D3C80_795320 [compost metagenome]
MANGGERRAGEARHLHVVVADHGDVVRHLDSGFPGGADGTDGHGIVKGKHRRRARREGQDPLHGIVAALALVIPFEDLLILQGQPLLAQGVTHPVQPLLGGRLVDLARDADDAGVTLLQQMAHGQARTDAGVVVDDVGKITLGSPVQHHLRHVLVDAQHVAQRGVDVGPQHQQAVDPLLHQHAQIVLLTGGLVLGVAQDQAVTLFEAVGFHPLHHFREEGVGTGGDQHAYGLGRVDLEAARYRIGRVVEFCHRLKHFLGCIFADPTGVIEYM